MELLWGLTPEGSRGPKPGLEVEDIVAAAVHIADAQGFEALSMRAVAERLGTGAMTLYRYLPGKAELVDLMVDRVSGRSVPPANVEGGWRPRLEHVARENLRLFLEHPWLLEVFPGRPPMGPGIVGKYDAELRSLEGCGLDDGDMDLVLGLVLGYVRGAAISVVDASRVDERTGRTDMEWWEGIAPVLAHRMTPERYPLAIRVGEAATARHGGTFDAELAFEFGLARVLDGIEVFIERPSGAGSGRTTGNTRASTRQKRGVP